MVPLALAMALLTAAVLGWACYRIAAQNGRLLLRIEGIERALAERRADPASAIPISSPPNPEPAPGLALGTVGNDFDLPDARGGRGTLTDHLGSRVVLVFIAPDCPHSRDLLSQIAPLSRRSADGDPALLVVSTGGADENLPLVQPIGVRAPVLLQEDWEVGDLYWVHATPAAYLLDAQGAIASSLVLSTPAVYELVATAHAPDPHFQSQVSPTQTTPRHSRVPLGQAAPLIPFQPGATVPDFSLPQLGGGTARPADFLGRRLLLVFLDQYCAACEALIPQIEEAHRRETAPDVLIVTCRADETAGAEAPIWRPSCPTVLQRGREVSIRFGVLATPAAYLIDESGTIADGPAIGVAAVAQLLTQLARELVR